MSKIELISIISPFVSAVLTAYITYRYSVNVRRVDILYENKIPAFKSIASNLIDFQNFCWGKVAYFEGNEYSPFYEEGTGVLNYRIKIAKAFAENSVFLSKNSKSLVKQLLNNMSILCNIEAKTDDNLNPQYEYERMAAMSDNIVEKLYRELNLIAP